MLKAPEAASRCEPTNKEKRMNIEIKQIKDKFKIQNINYENGKISFNFNNVEYLIILRDNYPFNKPFNKPFEIECNGLRWKEYLIENSSDEMKEYMKNLKSGGIYTFQCFNEYDVDGWRPNILLYRLIEDIQYFIDLNKIISGIQD